jgi:serum/glucocorticoid-regulated kinase 2
MYLRVLQDELQFPEDRSMDQDTKSLIRGVSVGWFALRPDH